MALYAKMHFLFEDDTYLIPDKIQPVETTRSGTNVNHPVLTKQ